MPKIKWVPFALCAIVFAGLIALVLARHVPVAEAAPSGQGTFYDRTCFSWRYYYAVTTCNGYYSCVYTKSTSTAYGGRVCLSSEAGNNSWWAPSYFKGHRVEEVVIFGRWKTLTLRPGSYISYQGLMP